MRENGVKRRAIKLVSFGTFCIIWGIKNSNRFPVPTSFRVFGVKFATLTHQAASRIRCKLTR